MANVRLESIQKSYDQTLIIPELNLEIGHQEFLVLVGPSGCGKSTILRMIAGLESITAGQLFIGDRQMNTVAPKDRDIAMVFQSYALYPHMSVFDNMAFGLKMRKTPKAEIKQRVESAAQMLDLTALLKRKPRQLSGGQRQRVALGRALVRDPQVFLMDEPLSNLDAKLRGQMRVEILKLHRQLGATTIYVTHDQVEAMTMGDRLVVLNKGQIQQVGAPEVVYHHPANRFVGNFIGQMAFLEVPCTAQAVQLSGDLSCALPPKIQQALAQSPLSKITVGIRPEHFSTDLEAAPEAPRLVVCPELVELLGHEKRIHFTLLGVAMTATLPSEAPVAQGQPLSLVLRLDQVSFFDPTTEQNLLETP